MGVTVKRSALSFAALSVMSSVAILVVGSASGRHFARMPGATAAAASPARPLAIVVVSTPRLAVPRYDTSGNYPQVRDRRMRLQAVNRGLRDALLADQRGYAPRARESALAASKRCRGIYATSFDRRLSSASTVVVSALMPATKLYPCGNTGRTWVAMTAVVPSGRRIEITDLFAQPSRGLAVLATAWKREFRRTQPARWGCVEVIPSAFRPTARNYRLFALTPRGLAVGFWQAPACNRLHAVVPYAILRPHLSDLGARLVGGVRAPR